MPVVFGIRRNRLVYIVTDILILQLRIAGAQSDQEVDVRVACQVRSCRSAVACLQLSLKLK